MYKENPKTKHSGIICAIPHSTTCIHNCEDCFFQSGRSYLEPLSENLPNMPSLEQVGDRIVRVNDGNDSAFNADLVMKRCSIYPRKFYNTIISTSVEDNWFDAPVVLTVNPDSKTDTTASLIVPIPSNLMYVRFRCNTWNLSLADTVIEHYTLRDDAVPVVLTFMAYHKKDRIPPKYQADYSMRKRTLNEYYAITTEAWKEIMERYSDNHLVYSCGTEGEDGDSHCTRCGNCLREYFNTIECMKRNNYLLVNLTKRSK